MKLKRYKHNPILVANSNSSWESGAVFNCGAVNGENSGVYLIYRAIPKGYTKNPHGSGYIDYISSLGCATSDDGFHFTRSNKPIIEPSNEYDQFGCEDPRITKLEINKHNMYLITYTALSAPAFTGYGNRVALASTKDFCIFHKHGVVIPGLESKNAVIFPELMDGKIVMLHRVVPNIQIAYFSDLEQLTKPEERSWSKYRARLDDFIVMSPTYNWEGEKIGPGAPPISTEAGWLLIYHGVDAKRVYRVGAALLDKQKPTKVIARSPYPILEPKEEYETSGDVNNVVFPVGAVVLEGTIYIYYGGADKYCCLATAKLDNFIDYLLKFSVN